MGHRTGHGGQRQCLSEKAIARATRATAPEIAQLLAEDQRRGIVFRATDGWRLTPRAERAFGPALRALSEEAVVAGRGRLRD